MFLKVCKFPFPRWVLFGSNIPIHAILLRLGAREHNHTFPDSTFIGYIGWLLIKLSITEKGNNLIDMFLTKKYKINK